MTKKMLVYFSEGNYKILDLLKKVNGGTKSRIVNVAVDEYLQNHQEELENYLELTKKVNGINDTLGKVDEYSKK